MWSSQNHTPPKPVFISASQKPMGQLYSDLHHESVFLSPLVSLLSHHSFWNSISWGLAISKIWMQFWKSTSSWEWGTVMETIWKIGAKWEQLPALCTVERSKYGLQIKFVLGWIHNYKIPEPKGFRASVCHLSPEQAAWILRLVLQLATIELRMRAVLSFFLSSILLF